MARIYGVDTQVRSPVSGKYFTTGPVMAEAPELLADATMALLGERIALEAYPDGIGRGEHSEMPLKNPHGVTDRTDAVDAGRQASADAVLLSYLFRFRQRVGRDFTVESPASVAFEMVLLDVPHGRVLWSGVVDETQRPLSEDLFQIKSFIQRKGRWLTAEELARSGLERVLATFPGR